MKLDMWFLKDEGRAYEAIQKLRKCNLSFGSLEPRSRKAALEYGIEVVHQVLESFKLNGIDVNDIDPGHGSGHILRDYVNALYLFTGLHADPREIHIGFLGGVFHDFGVALVDRYADATRAVRHAEVGALLLHELFEQTEHDYNLADDEQSLVSYSVAAHTHYLKPSTVKCSDGVERVVAPYDDLIADPIAQEFAGVQIPSIAVYGARWVDRLDVNGPTFVARHYLTLVKPHEDFSSDNGFYRTEFAEALRHDTDRLPNGRTMRGHLRMFADSQNNASPYGKFDYGRMVELRDALTSQLRSIIMPLDDFTAASAMGWKRAAMLDDAWQEFLGNNIEPNDKGKQAATDLRQMFATLPDESRAAWRNAFYETMRCYNEWSHKRQEFLNRLPKSWLRLPGITEDVRDVIRPCDKVLALIG